MLFYYVMILIIKKLSSSHKFHINFIVVFCNTIIDCSQVHLQPTESVDLQHTANIKRQVFIGGRTIVIR